MNPMSGGLRRVYALSLLSFILLTACGGGGAVLSGEGESCTKTADCEFGLKCVALVCVGEGGGEDVTGGDLVAEGDAIETCRPTCTGLVCGNGGCPDQPDACGVCSGDQSCQAGHCVEGPCVPDCVELACGDGGCQDQPDACGVCGDGESCEAGSCVSDACVPECEGMVCGDGGCDDQPDACGLCEDGWACQGGICYEGPCVPDCDGKACGDGGCQDQADACGVCGEDEVCTEGGLCEDVPLVCGEVGSGVTCIDQVDPCVCMGCVDDDDCSLEDDCICPDCAQNSFCSNPENCKDDGICDPYHEGCVCEDCTKHYLCGGECEPACDDKDCGSDSCGGSCGECGANFHCNISACEVDGIWTDPATGLVWENPPEGTLRDWDASMTYCADLALGGHDDWGLPTLGQARTILVGCAATETGGTCNASEDDCLGDCRDDSCDGCQEGGGPADSGYYTPAPLLPSYFAGYWTASEYSDAADTAWMLNYYTAFVGPAESDMEMEVRCVRNAL